MVLVDYDWRMARWSAKLERISYKVTQSSDRLPVFSTSEFFPGHEMSRIAADLFQCQITSQDTFQQSLRADLCQASLLHIIFGLYSGVRDTNFASFISSFKNVESDEFTE